ncbi:MAG: WbqC family protein [Rikenellaceae bacterium]
MIILPSTYLPSIEHFAYIVKGDYVIDLGEHYIKRSNRNRAYIMTANGIMALTVNIARANRPRTPMKNIEIDYSKRWQHQHWMAIVSAYKSSPFFDYYADSLEPIFMQKYERLVDFSLAITKEILRLLGLPAELKLSDTYVDSHTQDLDLRPKSKNDLHSAMPPYIQVFADRHPFAPNLSIVDLLFCEGPATLDYLSRFLSASLTASGGRG